MIAFGLRSRQVVFPRVPPLVHALARVFHVSDLLLPELPMMKTQWRMSRRSGVVGCGGVGEGLGAGGNWGVKEGRGEGGGIRRRVRGTGVGGRSSGVSWGGGAG